MEKFCRQIYVINELDYRNADKVINILHIILIFAKLVFQIMITINITSVITKNIMSLANYANTHILNFLIDTDNIVDSTLLVFLLVIVSAELLLLDIIDLVVNKERPLSHLIFMASLNYGIMTAVLLFTTSYDLGIILLVSILEPVIYLCIIGVIYTKIQYKNKVYHKIIADMQKTRK